MADDEYSFRELVWVGSSKRDFMEFTEEIRAEMGYGLYRAQQGREHASAKALKGFGGRAAPQLDKDMIVRRLREAEAIHRSRRDAKGDQR